MKNPDVAILINSCDKYSDLWDSFFYILYLTWPKLNYPIYLNTESKNYNCKYFPVNVINSHCDENDIELRWGARLINCINRIPQSYIIILLDDYFCKMEIDIAEVEKCIIAMKENDNIASIVFAPTGNDYVKGSLVGFRERERRELYKLNTSPSIWKKNILLEFTNKNDTPWDWEFFGSFRTWFDKRLYYSRLNSATLIFDYAQEWGGGVHRGKWVGCHIRAIEEKWNIIIPLGSREMVYDWRNETSIFVKRTLLSILKNRWKIMINILNGLIINWRHRWKRK